MLSKVEFSIIVETLLRWEPVHVLYKERKEYGVTFNSLIEALVNLLDLSYVECYAEEDIDRPVAHLTKDELLEHYGGDLSEEEVDKYPNNVEYYFKATQKGEDEALKDIYDTYYPIEPNYDGGTHKSQKYTHRETGDMIEHYWIVDKHGNETKHSHWKIPDEDWPPSSRNKTSRSNP